MSRERIKKRLMDYKYLKEETLYIDDWNDDFISLQPSSQYSFYDYVNMDKIKLIVNFLFKNGIGRVWVGNWIYNKEGVKNE
jgi:hypothetical protein